MASCIENQNHTETYINSQIKDLNDGLFKRSIIIVIVK